MSKIKPPPSWWMEARLQEGMPRELIISKWEVDTTRAKRTAIRLRAAKKAQRLEDAKRRIANGAADVRTLNFVKNGGFKKHKTRKDALRAQREVVKAAHARRSEERLKFRQRTSTRCANVNCVIGSTPGTSFFSFLDYDHLKQSTKIKEISQLCGDARKAELPKTEVKCLFHHFLHTRSQLGYAAADSRSTKVETDIAELKGHKGCQHPHHAKMQYASMVPSFDEDPRIYGFLNVTYLKPTRRTAKRNGSRHYDKMIRSLESGEAIVLCHFCYKLYALCSDAKFRDTATTQHQFALLKQHHPEFIEHFEQCTTDVDWNAERAHRNKRVTEGLELRRSRAIADEQPIQGSASGEGDGSSGTESSTGDGSSSDSTSTDSE